MALRNLGPRVAIADTRIARPPAKEVNPHYTTPEHRAWRAVVVARAGGRCQDPACASPARGARLYADHVIELRDGGDALDLANGMARCAACHARKTLAERARRMAYLPKG